MSDKIIIQLREELSVVQKNDLSDILNTLMDKYQPNVVKDYYAGLVDGLNIAYKVINGIEDDYQHS
jgi:hypothetical protein